MNTSYAIWINTGIALFWLFILVLTPLDGHAQTRVITGSIGINQYGTGYKNKNFRYRSFSEEKSGAGVLSFEYLKAEDKKRQSVELSVVRRTLIVNTFSGGLAGGGSNEIDMDLTYLNLAGFLGGRIGRTTPLYIDVGGYLGIPLVRKLVDDEIVSILPPFNSGNGREIRYDPNEYLTNLEFGIILKTGFQFKVSEQIAISTAFRLHCGVGGRKHYNMLAFDKMALFGVGYILGSKAD